MLRTQVYLLPEQVRFLKEIAQEQEVSLSEVLRRLIDEKVKVIAKSKSRVNSGDWLLFLVKQARKFKFSGKQDLAQRVDFYLYEETK